MTCFSINYTRYCHRIKLSIIIIRFRDIFRKFAIVELFQKRNFNSLFLSVWKVWNLVLFFPFLSILLFFPLFSSPLRSPSYSLFNFPILSSLLRCFPLLFSPLIFPPSLLSSSLLFFLLLSSSLLSPNIFLHSD